MTDKKYTRTKVYKNLSSAMTVCFWCNKPKGKIIALDKEWGNEPFVFDYEPCEICKRRWKRGLVVIEVTMEDPGDGRPKINEDQGPDTWPTGRIYVLTDNGVKKLFHRRIYEKLKESDAKVMFMDIVPFSNLIKRGGNHHGRIKIKENPQGTEDETGTLSRTEDEENRNRGDN